MAKEGRSFFERLTGTVNVDDFEEEMAVRNREPLPSQKQAEPIVEQKEHNMPQEREREDWMEEESEEGQLTVDVYNTPNEIVIKAIVAGVKPDNLDISITRDMVTIRGKREEHHEASDEEYFYKELYWGSFARTILLPQEIEVEQASAKEKHGLLTIRLPKIDKEKQTKLKVKTG